MSGTKDSARFRRISLLICFASLSFWFLIGISCSLTWGESRQSANLSTANDASSSPAVAIGQAEAGNWGEAVAFLRPFVKRDPSQEEAWFWLGYSEFNLHQFARATYALQQAVKINPQDSKAFYQLGLSFLEMGRPYKAYQAWITTIKLDPGNSVVPYYIGRLMVDAGRLTEAEKWLKRVEESSPVSYRARYYQGFCNEKLDRTDEAINLYRQSLQLCIRSHKTFSAPYTRLAKVLMRMKMDSEARKVLEEGASRAPDGNLLTIYGEFLIHEHEYDKARTLLARASQMDPSLPDPHYLLGRLLTQLNQTPKAEQELRTYRELKAQQLSAWEKRHLFQALQFDKYLAITNPTKMDTGSSAKNSSR
jgi:Flp pilus assembly protein TadD